MSGVQEKKEIIYWAKLLNDKDLTTARNGNISLKCADKILITAHDAYLGYLEEKDIVTIDAQGKLLDGVGEPSSEKEMHLGIHNKFKDVNVVIHAHSPYSTAFFHYFDKLDIFSYEAKFYLGNLPVVPQRGPLVTDVAPVLKALENSNIVILGNHGVVAMGRGFKDTFSLLELLEEQARVSFTAKAMRLVPHKLLETESEHKSANRPRLKLFSAEHIKALNDFVNNDPEVRALGEQLNLTCTLAVRNEDNNEAVTFYYEKGRIVKTENNAEAEFVINAAADVLKKVFNREIDPFVATTQGKVKMKGDFSRLSRWYPVMIKTFALWGKVEVF